MSGYMYEGTIVPHRAVTGTISTQRIWEVGFAHCMMRYSTSHRIYRYSCFLTPKPTDLVRHSSFLSRFSCKPICSNQSYVDEKYK